MPLIGRAHRAPTQSERMEELKAQDDDRLGPLNDEGKAIHQESRSKYHAQQHMLLRKSPWVERAESKELPVKELTK